MSDYDEEGSENDFEPAPLQNAAPKRRTTRAMRKDTKEQLHVLEDIDEESSGVGRGTRTKPSVANRAGWM